MIKLCMTAGVLAALAAGQALADENSGLFFGAGIGDFSSDINDIDDVDIDFDADDDALRLFGGWRFNRFFALQLDYMDLGESTAAVNLLDVTSETTAIVPSVVGTLPLGPVELFAKAGMAFYDVEVSTDNDSLIDDSGNDVVYGAGIGITLLERLSLRVEYEVFEISDFDDADALWLTAAWRF